MRTRALIRTLAFVLSLLPAAVFGAEDFTRISIEPGRPTPEDPVRIAVSIGDSYDPNLRFVGIQGNRIVFEYDDLVYPSDRPLPPVVRWTTEATVGPLPAGIYTVAVRSSEADGSDGIQRTFEVVKPSPALMLQESEDTAFAVSVDFDLPQGPSGIGYGVPLTRESGYFWFFSPENVELTVKVLDGRGTNGRYWVFIASMTDLPFTVTVQQCPTNPQVGQPCSVKTYTNSKGVNRNIIDVNAFPEL